jgi:hypothetical protein
MGEVRIYSVFKKKIASNLRCHRIIDISIIFVPDKVATSRTENGHEQNTKTSTTI